MSDRRGAVVGGRYSVDSTSSGSEALQHSGRQKGSSDFSSTSFASTTHSRTSDSSLISMPPAMPRGGSKDSGPASLSAGRSHLARQNSEDGSDGGGSVLMGEPVGEESLHGGRTAKDLGDAEDVGPGEASLSGWWGEARGDALVNEAERVVTIIQGKAVTSAEVHLGALSSSGSLGSVGNRIHEGESMGAEETGQMQQSELPRGNGEQLPRLAVSLHQGPLAREPPHLVIQSPASAPPGGGVPPGRGTGQVGRGAGGGGRGSESARSNSHAC